MPSVFTTCLDIDPTRRPGRPRILKLFQKLLARADHVLKRLRGLLRRMDPLDPD